MKLIELIPIVAALLGIIQFAIKIWKGQLTKAKVTPDEYDFFVKREDNLSSSEKEFRLLVEKQLLDKAYGFIATKEQFHELNSIREGTGRYNWNQFKLIGSYIYFDKNKPYIKISNWEFIFTSFVSLLFSIAIFTVLVNGKKTIAEDLNLDQANIQVIIAFNFTVIILLAIYLYILRYYVLPIILANNIKKKLNHTCSKQNVNHKSMHSFLSRKRILNFIGIGGLLYFVVVGILFFIAHPNPIDFTAKIDTQAFADYGSHIAGMATFFAFLFAFASFWENSKANKIQQFESTFFNMLEHFDSIISQISINAPNRVATGDPVKDKQIEINGRSALIQLLNDFIKTANVITVEEIHTNDFTDSDCIKARWREMYEKNTGILPHYFRYYYTILKFIMTSDLIDDKKIYTDLLQAKMSSPEMGLIFYNTYYNPSISKQNGAQDLMKWLNDKHIGLLENIHPDSIIDSNDVKEKCKIDFKHL